MHSGHMLGFVGACLAAIVLVGCAEKVDMGSPVGKWREQNTIVTFHADGTVTRQGELPDSNVLEMLPNDVTGHWQTENRTLTVSFTQADGTVKSQRYEYSLGHDSQGRPALDIEIPEKKWLTIFVREP